MKSLSFRPCSAIIKLPTSILVLTLLASLYGCGGSTSLSTAGGAGKINSALFNGLAIEKVTYPGGPIEGGTKVVISGKGFFGDITVHFGGNPCSSIRATSPTEIQCTTPPHEAGPVAVEVTALSGLFKAKLSNAFTYNLAPKVSDMSPNHGSMYGGTLVTISGENFLEKASVTFAGSKCKKVRVISSKTITCLTPFRAASSVDVVVINEDLQTGKKPGAYSYRPQPFPSTIRVTSQKRIAGEPIAIISTGNFLTNKDFLSVYFQSWFDGEEL